MNSKMNVQIVHFENESKESMFAIVEITKLWIVAYHRKTKVMYIATHLQDTFSNFTVMVNADGTPMLWDGATNG